MYIFVCMLAVIACEHWREPYPLGCDGVEVIKGFLLGAILPLLYGSLCGCKFLLASL